MQPRIALQALVAAIAILLALPKDGAAGSPTWFTSAFINLSAVDAHGNTIFYQSNTIGSLTSSSLAQTFDLGGGGSVSVFVSAATGGTLSTGDIDINWTQGLQQLTVAAEVESHVQVVDYTYVNDIPEMVVTEEQIPGTISYSLLPNDQGDIFYADQTDNGIFPPLDILVDSGFHTGPGIFSIDVPPGMAGPSHTVEVTDSVRVGAEFVIAPRQASPQNASGELSPADAGTGSFHYDGASDVPAVIDVVPEPSSLIIAAIGISGLLAMRFRRLSA
jgi:hypothetical protein